MSLIIDHVIHVELKYQFEFMVSCKLILKKKKDHLIIAARIAACLL